MKNKLNKATKRELQAAKRLQKAIDSMPKTLFLYSNGTMCVMKYKPDGKPADTPHGGFDIDYCICEIKGIYSEGGDW